MYLGIWYKDEPRRTFVWVANRDSPISKSTGVLKILDDNIVILDDHSDLDSIVWSTTNRIGATRFPLVGELLDNGNFVLREAHNRKGEDGFLWQSFDFPTDTLLPGMKLGWDRKTNLTKNLTAWTTPNDPTSGVFTYKLNLLVPPHDFWIVTTSFYYPDYRVVPWDGNGFSGIPEINGMVYNFSDNKEEVGYTFTMINQSIYSRLSLNVEGVLNLYTRDRESNFWTKIRYLPRDDLCAVYDNCGAFGYCDHKVEKQPCQCFKGFRDMNVYGYYHPAGEKCLRTTPLSCREDDGFVQLKNMKWPDAKYGDKNATKIIEGIDRKECEERCLRDCDCTAYGTYNRIGAEICVAWIKELKDMQKIAVGGRDLYVRLAASELDTNPERNKKKKNIGWITGVTVTLVMVSLTATIIYLWKRKKTLEKDISAPTDVVATEMEDNVMVNVQVQVKVIKFHEIVIATDNFSEHNKLGKGGFGTVYKGRLSDGEEIAVKRLSKMSSQGVREFNNEVNLIAKLQHKNLVRLIGCCVDMGENMLIYEYLENLSLDFYIFGKTPKSKLNWQTRFDIIIGIARGIMYLHLDSRLKIIHRDLKTSNVLLDKDFVPKISDFGIAKIFENDDNEGHTRKVVGTFGYMSPEYAMCGLYSEKSDVYSFGVMILEIITGQKNADFSNNKDLNLLAWVWRHWNEENLLQVIDPFFTESTSTSTPMVRLEEVKRCLKLGLLCIQEDIESRPTMSAVVFILENKTAGIRQPQLPGFCIPKRTKFETDALETPPMHSLQYPEFDTV